MKEESKTAKCPECGSKYLVQTGYCVSCKKKVGKKESVIEIKEDVQIGDIILESGDKITVLKEMETADDILINITEPNGENSIDLIKSIGEAFDFWADGTQNNFDDDDAREWGYRNIEDAIKQGKNALINYLTEVLDKVYR